MRAAFSKALVNLALQDSNVLLLTGDHGYALFDDFRQQCPQQYLNAGIAEQNMVGMAAGLARMGYRPFVYGLSAFVPVRVLEQIKIDVAHDHLPVVFLGDGAGFVYSHLGTSHQSTEDIACTRAIPYLTIMSPSDRFEIEACLNEAYSLHQPVYLRMGKADRGDVNTATIASERIHNLIQIREGRHDVPALIATGSMVRTALDIAEHHLDASVWSVPMIKPINTKTLCEISRTYPGVVTLEEHSIYGGLGSVVVEVLSEVSPTRVLRIGVMDRFSKYCGSYAYLLQEHGLDVDTVLKRIQNFFK